MGYSSAQLVFYLGEAPERLLVSEYAWYLRSYSKRKLRTEGVSEAVKLEGSAPTFGQKLDDTHTDSSSPKVESWSLSLGRSNSVGFAEAI